VCPAAQTLLRSHERLSACLIQEWIGRVKRVVVNICARGDLGSLEIGCYLLWGAPPPFTAIPFFVQNIR
jgi:hypothetical protein